MNAARFAMFFSVAAGLLAQVSSTRIAWEELPPMMSGVAGGAGALIGGRRLLYAGGTMWAGGVKHWLNQVRVYDASAKSWGAGPSLPEPVAYGASVRIHNSLDILGGMNDSGPSRNCWRLDSKLTGWVKTGVLQRNAVLARAEQVNDAIYLFGGCSDVSAPMGCSDEVWSGDGHGKWARIGAMPDGAVALRASTVIDSRIFLFGGCSEIPGGVQNNDSAYSFDAHVGAWRKLRPLPVAARGLSAANLGDGRILLVGGYTASTAEAASSGPEFGFSDQVWIYSTSEDRYENATPFPFAVSGIELLIHDGAILALGGEDRMRGRSRRYIQGKVR